MTKEEHIDLAKKFNDFAYQLFNAQNSIDCCKDNPITLKRIVYGRLYYALYHNQLANSESLRNSSGPNIHASLKESVQRTKNDKLIQVYNTLYSLRISSDYQSDVCVNKMEKKPLKYYLQQVYDIIKTKVA